MEMFWTPKLAENRSFRASLSTQSREISAVSSFFRI